MAEIFHGCCLSLLVFKQLPYFLKLARSRQPNLRENRNKHLRSDHWKAEASSLKFPKNSQRKHWNCRCHSRLTSSTNICIVRTPIIQIFVVGASFLQYIIYRPFKVIQGQHQSNRIGICDFVLVNNSNFDFALRQPKFSLRDVVEWQTVVSEICS